MCSETVSGAGSWSLLRRQRHPLENLPGLRVNHDQVVRFARSDQPTPVRAQRERLRPHARQLDLQPGWREDLVGRGVISVRADVANNVLRRSLGDRRRRLRRLAACEQGSDCNGHAEAAFGEIETRGMLFMYY